MNAELSGRKEPVGVVSAAVFQDSSMSKVLLGVRKSTPLVKRHPGVLSTLTVGVPVEILNILTADLPQPSEDGEVLRLSTTSPFTIGAGGYLGSIHAFIIESLLARKVGMARALTMGSFVAQGRLQTISLDTVDDPLGTQEPERTRMLTYSVAIVRGVPQIPQSTPSYSRLVWVDANRVGEALEKRDALLLDSTLNPFEVCIHGLCVRSIVAAMER